jgi:M6 family metalloprotease-like protein
MTYFHHVSVGFVPSAVSVLILGASVAQAQTDSAAGGIRGLNNQVLRLHGEMQRGDARTAAELRRQASAAIAQRAAEMSALIEKDPAQVLSMAFSADVLTDLAAKFPEAAGQLESQGTWQGPAEYWIADYPSVSSRTIVKMKSGGQNLEVHFAGPLPPELKCGDNLEVTGIRVGSALAVSDGKVQPMAATTTNTTSATCSTTGVQNTAVLLVTFPGATPPSNITPENVHDMFFGATGPSMDGYWREASYGRTSATGGVFGWFTLDSSYANCGRLDLLRDAAITAATNAGVNFQNYQRIFIVHTDFGCGWTGLSMGGCTTLNSPTGSFTASASYLDASWQRSQTEGAENAAHEGGHNMGLAHAQSRTYGTEPLGPLGAAGTLTEYGDPFSDMSSSNIGHYTTPHKAEILNWISSGTNYQVVQTSGIWTLQPLELNPAGLVALKVQRGAGNNAWLWVEYRQPIGIYDSTVWPSSAALIHYEDSTTGAHTQLLDFTPGTAGMYDAGLIPGSTWVDPYTNVSITVQSATASALTVNVNYGTTPCTHATPTVGAAPANPSVYAASSANYTVSVTNNDSSGCTGSTFGLTSSQPSGWAASFSATSVTLNPGQTGTVAMTQTAPAGTTPATYPVGATAVNGTMTGTGNANCTIMAAPAFSVGISVPSSSYSARQTVSTTAAVQNNGAGVANASVTFTLTRSNGSRVTNTAKTGSTGQATWSYKLGPKDPTGTYSVVVQAASGSQTATSNTVTFIVQ